MSDAHGQSIHHRSGKQGGPQSGSDESGDEEADERRSSGEGEGRGAEGRERRGGVGEISLGRTEYPFLTLSLGRIFFLHFLLGGKGQVGAGGVAMGCQQAVRGRRGRRRG